MSQTYKTESLPPRATALSESERRLEELCRRTFLGLWSYPGVCRDQGPGGGESGGKEICDLFVVFENHIIIFSDKTCDFPNTGDLSVGWDRWYRRAIQRSAKQLRGAERWIRQHPERIFLDRRCKYPFPYPLPSLETARFHRVLVAGGASEPCRRHFGGNGSLILTYGDKGGTRLADGPFVIGRPDDGEGFIHVFDDFTLHAVLESVNTIADFTAYLAAKEDFLQSGPSIWAAGEEELLAHYLKHSDRDGRHCFKFPTTPDVLVIEEGGWQEFQSNPQRIAQLAADEVSFAWDRLIEKFTHFATTSGLEFANYESISEFEGCIRFMAREPRVKRRMLAKALLGVMQKTRPGLERANRVVLPMNPGDPHWVFLCLRRPSHISQEAYREVRRNLIYGLCVVTRARWRDATDIVGVATSPMDDRAMSEDLIYMDGRDWTPELEAEAGEFQRELGLLTNVSLVTGHEKEYPDLPVRTKAPARNTGLRIGRNEPCPCASGKKYKKCCGSGS